MIKNAEEITRLLNLKSGEEVWACNRVPVFTTDNGYFGHYTWLGVMTTILGRSTALKESLQTSSNQ